jgi:hypothetical protein
MRKDRIGTAFPRATILLFGLGVSAAGGCAPVQPGPPPNYAYGLPPNYGYAAPAYLQPPAVPDWPQQPPTASSPPPAAQPSQREPEPPPSPPPQNVGLEDTAGWWRGGGIFWPRWQEPIP